MTNEEAIRWLKLNIDMTKFDPTTGDEAYLNQDARNVIEAQEMAIKALEAMDDDMIRRQDALNCFHAWIDKHGDVQEPDDMAEYRAIEALPSVMEDEE